MLRARQIPQVLRKATHDPSLLLTYGRQLRLRHKQARRSFSLAPYADDVVTLDQALQECLEVDAAEIERLHARFWAPEPDTSSAAAWNARPDLQSLVSAIVRSTKPSTMVEIGVAQGYTTAVALRAMRDVGTGHLYSIDLPALEYDERSFVGRRVPEDLRGRWTLELGPSQRLLPKVLQALGEVDIFVHDGDHTYEVQMQDYRVAWPHVRSGGLFVSDDVINPAFIDFVQEQGLRPLLIGTVAVPSALGIVRKP